MVSAGKFFTVVILALVLIENAFGSAVGAGVLSLSHEVKNTVAKTAAANILFVIGCSLPLSPKGESGG
jgi:hypothetical protein